MHFNNSSFAVFCLTAKLKNKSSKLGFFQVDIFILYSYGQTLIKAYCGIDIIFVTLVTSGDTKVDGSPLSKEQIVLLG